MFLRLKIKLTGCHFDTIEVIETESQAVLNTLIEHAFQDELKKIAEALGTVHMRGRVLLRGVMVATRHKREAASVPKIMDCSMYL
jgi:hypothetical protein